MPPKQPANEFIGKVYERLTILEDLGIPNGGDRTVLAKCKCGAIRTYLLYNLKSGKTKSCGCYGHELTGIRSFKHGLKNHKLYDVWSAIKDRCYNKNDVTYKYYGGRGVTVCDEWRNDFLSFYNWSLSNGWEIGLEIDKDIVGNGKIYSPDTCCFVTKKENCNKRRSNKYITFKGETKTVSQWSDHTGIPLNRLYKRLDALNWSVEKALTTPKRGKQIH